MSLFGKDIFWYRDNILINEAFIGKTQTLLAIEEEFSKLKSEDHKMTDNLSTNPHIIKINRLFEKQFGMDIFALKILPTKEHNGYTSVLGRRIDIAKEVDLPSMVTGDINSGFRFKQGNDFIILVYLSYGILFDEKITPGQIVAVILHEIGHNFADCLYGKINEANKDLMKQYEKWLIQYAVNKGLLNALLHGRSVAEWVKIRKIAKSLNNKDNREKEHKYRKSSRTKNKIRGLIKGIQGKNKDWQNTVAYVKAKIKGGSRLEAYKRNMGSSAKNAAAKSVDRQNEVFADKFAGVYGYGPEIAASLTVMQYKRTKADDIIAKLPKMFRKAAAEYDDAARNMHDFDCHPQLVQRINEEIKLLERELAKDDVDPKVKKVISDQLEQLRKILEDITNSKSEIGKNDEAQTVYNAFVRDNCPDAVSEEIEDEIEEALDKLIEDSKKQANKE